LILDPFGGSGTTIDVCKAMNRKWKVYDLQPARSDIEKHDVTDGIPMEDNSVNFIILDPPYAFMKKGRYTDKNSDLSQMSVVEFYSIINDLAKECNRVLKHNGHVAFITSSLKREDKYEDLAFKCCQSFLANGFRLEERIIVPYHTAERLNVFWLARAKKRKFMLRGYRDLMVFKKIVHPSWSSF
jgi:DNA modification methylase